MDHRGPEVEEVEYGGCGLGEGEALDYERECLEALDYEMETLHYERGERAWTE